MRFRKRPVVIDATQWSPGAAVAGVVPVPERERHKLPAGAEHESFGWIETLEGGHVVTEGDWVITGVKGERYPCKPDIFAATYEPAE